MPITKEHDRLMIGETARIEGKFYNNAGTLADPVGGTITFYIRKPNATVLTLVYGTDAEVIRESTGIYYVNQALDASGRWKWEVTSVGNDIDTSDDGNFRVTASWRRS